MIRFSALLAFAAVAASAAHAQDFSVRGLAVARVVAPSDERSWLDGGFGRLRYGSNTDDPGVYLSDLYLETNAQFGSAWSATATLKRDPEQDAAIDLVEGFVRYRPVSTGRLQASARAGAFFPELSFENDDIGWTSSYASTTSAINSWIGEEIRVVGAEAALAWRGERRTFSARAAGFGWNDPAGVLLAVRGWGFTDRTTGIADDVALHDQFAAAAGRSAPYSEEIIREIDDRPGWYAGAQWEETDRFTLRIMRYDNRADPAAVRNGQQAWLTKFWSAGAIAPVGPWSLIAQGMIGCTDIEKAAGYLSTDFASAFMLVARDVGAVRASARAEFFRTDESVDGVGQNRKEDGGAATFAVRWFAHDHAEIVAEAVQVWSDRPERAGAGLPASADETQVQFLVRGRF